MRDKGEGNECEGIFKGENLKNFQNLKKFFARKFCIFVEVEFTYKR